MDTTTIHTDRNDPPSLAGIRMLVVDCDGVLTDGQVLVDANGEEVKRFSLRDGHGFGLARKHGLRVAIITRKPSPALEARARKLGVEDLIVSEQKGVALKRLCVRRGVSPSQAVFIGDDVFDLPAMEVAGCGIAVADAHPRVQASADYVTTAGGGGGAVREVIDLWLTHHQAPKARIKSTLDAGRTYVIAEIGNNHQGDPEIARELIRAAKLCGVDAVKSQKRDIGALLSPEEHRRPYDSPHAFGRTYGEHREALELSTAVWSDLLAYATGLGLDFFASPWDLPSAELLHHIGCPLMKVPSAALTNHPLLNLLGDSGRPVILSTGMSTIDEIDGAVTALEGCAELYLMQCTSAYPAPFDSINLRAMQTLSERYGLPVGLSGHHKGIAVDAAAVGLGARIIERHFTLDRTQRGSDHAASLEPQGLGRLVRNVRAVEAALGDGVKRVQACEEPARDKLRGASQRAAGPRKISSQVA